MPKSHGKDERSNPMRIPDTRNYAGKHSKGGCAAAMMGVFIVLGTATAGLVQLIGSIVG